MTNSNWISFGFSQIQRELKSAKSSAQKQNQANYKTGTKRKSAAHQITDIIQLQGHFPNT